MRSIVAQAKRGNSTIVETKFPQTILIILAFNPNNQIPVFNMVTSQFLNPAQLYTTSHSQFAWRY